MRKDRKGISIRQLSAVIWTAVLAPAAGTLSGATARTAGAAGWLAILIALPAVLLTGRMVWSLTRQGKDDLAQACCRVLGKGLGGAVVFLYIIWCVVLLALRLRLGGQRLLFVGRQMGAHWFYLPALLAVALWFAWGSLPAFARAAQLFCPALMALLGAVTLLAAFRVRWLNLWPLWTRDLLSACRAALSVLGTLCSGIYGAFLMGGPSEEKQAGKRWNRYTAGICLSLSAVQAVILGNFGAQVTARLEDPFLALSRSVGVEGAFQRLEGLAAAFWVLSDLVMLAMLLRAGARMGQQVLPRWSGKGALAAGAVLALLGAAAGFPDAYAAQRFEQTAAPVGNLILGLGVPAVLFLLSKAKGDPRQKHTSCGLKEGS